MNGTAPDGTTPLITTACEGSLAAIKALVEAGAKKDMCDNQGRTALMWATLFAHVDLVKYLLAQRANRALADKEGGRAIDFAQVLAKDQSDMEKAANYACIAELLRNFKPSSRRS